jgi:predicted metal-dependent phosphoesterase TrpH
MIYDLHVHSICSRDSFLGFEKIIKLIKKIGIDGVAITDHDTIKGGLELKKINKNEDFQVIVGIEIKTQIGDIIGLFLNEEINSREFYNVIESIKDQGGLIVLPHPYRGHDNIEKIIHEMDLVEGFNARSKYAANINSQLLARKFCKPMTGGSDAHTPFEVGRGLTFVQNDIEDELRNGRTTIKGSESNYYLYHAMSHACKKLRSYMEVVQFLELR